MYLEPYVTVIANKSLQYMQINYFLNLSRSRLKGLGSTYTLKMRTHVMRIPVVWVAYAIAWTGKSEGLPTVGELTACLTATVSSTKFFCSTLQKRQMFSGAGRDQYWLFVSPLVQHIYTWDQYESPVIYQYTEGTLRWC